jgi:hypothetical protein
MERCCYGAMSDAQFDAHRVVIVENYAHSDTPLVRIYVPGGQPYVAAASGEDETVVHKSAVEARNRCEKFRAEGKSVQYMDVLNDVRKENKLAPVA